MGKLNIIIQIFQTEEFLNVDSAHLILRAI